MTKTILLLLIFFQFTSFTQNEDVNTILKKKDQRLPDKYFLEQNIPSRCQLDFTGTDTTHTFIPAEVANQLGKPVFPFNEGIRVHYNEKFRIAVPEPKVEGGTLCIAAC